MNRRKMVIVSIAACLAIIALGFVTMRVLASLRKPPAEAEIKERALQVEALTMEPKDHAVSLVENGVARSLNVVPVTPEVSGMVVQIHPRLEVGEVIPKGDLLVVIDPRDYEAQVQAAEAETARLKANISRIRTELANDRERIKTLERSRDLAESEFERLKTLYETDEVGTKSGVEAAERQWNAAQDAVDQMQRALSVYPITIQETQSALAAAQARLEQAKANLGRTRITAPFDARVKSVSVEEGQFVAPGSAILTLADDSVIEIAVSIDSRDARRWLKFREPSGDANTAWFTHIEPVECTVRWTEDPSGHTWTGVLDRVQAFDMDTRKLTVAVRVDGATARNKGESSLPLVDGMFCSVSIPGREMKDVYRLPQWAVSFDGSVNDGSVFVSEDGRLAKQRVRIARRDTEYVYVDDGLEPGDVVIITRLVNPLENSLLDIDMFDSAQAAIK